MRPADENQHSTRPNLMSSGRRTGSDQSILEMLDRDSGRGTRRKGRSRLAWYGLGGALATGLVGLLVWLTHEGPAPQEAQPVVVADVPGVVERAAKPDVADDLANLSDLDDPPRPHHAAVVDEPPARQSKAAVTMPAPPPVAAASKGALVRDEPNPQDNSGPHPNDTHERTLAAAPASPHPMQHIPAAPGSAGPRREPAKALQTHAPAETPKNRSAIKLAQSAAHDEPRKNAHAVKRARKQAAPAKAAQPVVDSDVALISAVIQHATARPNGDCADRNCAAKTTAQP